MASAVSSNMCVHSAIGDGEYHFIFESSSWSYGILWSHWILAITYGEDTERTWAGQPHRFPAVPLEDIEDVERTWATLRNSGVCSPNGLSQSHFIFKNDRVFTLC